MSHRWVVVGAGSAGGVVAARLGERPGHDVVLVEAGPDHADAVGVDWLDATRDPDRIFADLRARRAVGGQRTTYVRGRGVGGSGAINAMLAPPGGPVTASHRLRLTTSPAEQQGPVDRALLAASPHAAPVPMTWADGRRSSVVDAYLRPAVESGDVELRVDSPVRRVAFDGRRAVGVELDDGRQIDADSVVMCAGAVHTPTILLRSGCEVPGLGEGLQDHPAAAITLALRAEAASGPGAHAATVVASEADTHVVPLNHLGRAAPGLGLLLVGLMTPTSRGSVRLDPDDPWGEPIVEVGSLSTDVDRLRMAEAVWSAIGLLEHPAFERIVEAAFIDDAGTPVGALDSRSAVAAWLPAHLGDYFHASCTCRVGTVVDPTGALIGHDGLFVCDASVFDVIPSTNTHLPTVMLSEAMVPGLVARAG